MILYAVWAIVKATLVCGAAFLLAGFCRRTRASIRHLLFSLAFTALIVIPVADTVLPTVVVTLPAAATTLTTRAHEMFADVPSIANPDAFVSREPVSFRASTVTDTTRARSLTIAQAIVIAWSTGVLLCLLPVLVGSWQVRRLRRSAYSWAEGRMLVQRLAPALGVSRPVAVLLHGSVTGPMTCGVIRPAIVLPANAERWDESSIKCAVTHELEHVARWDFLTLCLSRVVCAAYWFHPLVWAAWRRLRLEAERACDDAVLREADAEAYASLLVSLAQRQPAGARLPLLAMAGRGDLTARVTSVLDNARTRGRIGRRRTAGVVAAAAIVMLIASSVTFARANPQATDNAAARPRFATVSINRNTGFETPAGWCCPETGISATNLTTRHLVLMAYAMQNKLRWPYQIDGAPDWIDSDRFDVQATAPPGTTRQQTREMLESLLADRFKLEVHIAPKDLPAYALVVARQDGVLGPRITPTSVDCRPRPGGSSPCGLSGTRGRLLGRGVTMAKFVAILAAHLGATNHIPFDRPLLDRTELGGAYDFTVEWIPDPKARDERPPNQRVPQFRPNGFPIETTAPNFLAALEEQLGLKLDNQLTPGQVLVIDRIEPPIEN